MIDIKSTNAGDRVFAAWVFVEHRSGVGAVEASTRVKEGVVFSPEHGLVQFAGEAPRALYSLETPFSSPEDAWRHCAARVRKAADTLQLAARTCDENAVAALMGAT